MLAHSTSNRVMQEGPKDMTMCKERKGGGKMLMRREEREKGGKDAEDKVNSSPSSHITKPKQ